MIRDGDANDGNAVSEICKWIDVGYWQLLL